ncbi:radical SAM protein [Barnesiella propionica]|uniref:radical SAM/SPASM domain-containing protein n=1 Tax=Barnesiella propionica TaxID=2981781 RepID=UPI0011CA830C|nr:radical SAM protein [Barnesiella propionica]MCU6768540.1 radical SAM protein [Barnesiella propionica]
MEDFSTLLRNDTLIQSNPYRIITYNNKNIIVIPNSGAWIIGGHIVLSLLDKCKIPIPYMDIKNIFPNANIQDIIETLYYSGIILLDDKCSTDQIVAEEKYKSLEVAPRLLVLKYTNHCNLRCSYCYAYKEETFNDNLNYKDIETAVKLISDSYGKNITVVFHGGEPLLRFKDMKHDVISLLDKFPDIQFSIQTNGTLMNDEISVFLKKHKISIGVSIDGIDEISNSLRCFTGGLTSCNKTLDGIKCLFKHNNQPSASIVMTKKNKDDILITMQRLFEIGIRHFVVLDYFPAGRGKEGKDHLALNLEENIAVRRDILLFINDHNAKQTDSKNLITERRSIQLMKKIVYWRSLYMCSESPCGAGRRMLALGADGNLYPCDEFISNDKEFVIDHVSNITNLADSLKNSKVVQKCYAHRIENISKCSKCVWRNICEFHCAGNSFYFNGSLNQPSSLCEYFHRMIPMTMELLYEERINPKNIL